MTNLCPTCQSLCCCFKIQDERGGEIWEDVAHNDKQAQFHDCPDCKDGIKGKGRKIKVNSLRATPKEITPSSSVGLTVAKAETMKEDFNKKFPKVAAYFKAAKDEVN